MELFNMTAFELAHSIKSRQISAVEVIQKYLNVIKMKEPCFNAFITLNEENALKSASLIDKRITNNENVGVLAGVPISIKDNICTEGLRTTCASKMLKEYIPTYNATVIDRLLREDCIIIGKTNMDEFGMGNTSESSYFGAVRNPYNADYVSGGSSGGSCASVALGECMLSIGSDTGGSVRLPSSYCGVVGLKPTYGMVSRYGLIAYGSSLEQIGPIGKNVTDCVNVLSIIAGKDEKDSTTIGREKYDFSRALTTDVKGMKIGVPKEYFSKGIDGEVEKAIRNALDILEKQGAIVEEISLGYAEYAVAAYYVIACAEASSNLSRYDGVKYGYRCEEYKSLEEMYKNTRSEGFGREVKKRIALGTFVLSSGFYDEYYLRALKIKNLIKGEFDKVYNDYDVIISPVSPTVAPKIDSCKSEHMDMYLRDVYTVSANLAGLPAISVPIGKSESGLPIGIQVMGNCFREDNVIRIAYTLEQEGGLYE